MNTNFDNDLKPISDYAEPGSKSYMRTLNRAKKCGALFYIGEKPHISVPRFARNELDRVKPQSETEKIDFHFQKYPKIKTTSKINQIIDKIQEGLDRKYKKLTNFYDRLENESDEETRKGINDEIEKTANTTRNSELKLVAANRRKSQIFSNQTTTISEIKKCLQKRNAGNDDNPIAEQTK